MLLSPVQYGTLNHFTNRDVTVTELRNISNVTIRALLRRGFIHKSGRYIVVTTAGHDARDEYRHARVPRRKREAPLSPQVEELLRAARMTMFPVLQGRKTA